jgi:RNA-dependent RNA polymerase
MIIADQSPFGIRDADCMRLADLHSDAVDYPKSGQPVSIRAIPRLKFPEKPDWNAPETVTYPSAKFYKSKTAVGRLCRAIRLPAVQKRNADRPMHHQLVEEDEESLDGLFSDLVLDDAEEGPVYDAVKDRVSEFIDTDFNDTDVTEHASQMFSRYASELRTICATHTLSFSKSAMLSEEEAVIGTIVAKSSQPRRRKDLMSKLREQTDLLVRGMREDLTGDEGTPLDEWLERAWVAWKVSLVHRKLFGARSFGWVSLGGIFEAIKAIKALDDDW